MSTLVHSRRGWGQNWSTFGPRTLDSRIDVAPGINVAPGTFGKNNKRSPMFIIESRVDNRDSL